MSSIQLRLSQHCGSHNRNRTVRQLRQLVLATRRHIEAMDSNGRIVEIQRTKMVHCGLNQVPTLNGVTDCVNCATQGHLNAAILLPKVTEQFPNCYSPNTFRRLNVAKHLERVTNVVALSIF
jgi:hypothetical protein